MAFSIYRASIPVLIRGFENLTDILKKGEAFAAEKGLAPGDLLEARLYEDMHNLIKQVQLASDSAKGCGARLAGIENPSFPDEESNFAELHARIGKTVDFLKTISERQLDGAEAKTITMKVRGRELNFTGADYLLNFALPNFYFHVTTAYDILRHKGVPLSKLDYLGKL
ncbi:DUF1993 domain-containing protein [Dongia rigui]|uniref:DUF1993 domain-containing protein n=1 Tax=Dongia rigui TaxID=940149 RepID=A0ABU5E3A8_9PROT|nr:DUF1993 domain-containing protein [Dongia rigui]MDY0873665.1 DUF1993 domain-containing protein [Dongia rigui]